jgi:general secretion pathway protein L
LTRKVYIRPVPAQDTPVEQWHVECLVTDEQGDTGQVKQSQFAELKNELKNVKLVLIIPAEQVLLLPSVMLPGKNLARIKQALPFALEDQVIGDIDEQYFVLGPRLSEQQYAVAVVEKAYLENLLDRLRSLQVYPDVVLPESLLIPLHEGKKTVVEDGDRVIVRTSKFHGFACDKENLQFMLNSLAEGNAETVESVMVYGSQAGIAGELSGYQCEQQPVPNKLISLLYHDTGTGLNLLPARYVRREKFDKKLRPWLPAAAMLLIWLVVQLTVQVYDFVRLKKQDLVLQQSLEKIYRQTFPGARKIVNVEVQMRQRLEELRKRSGKTESGFTEMLARSAPVLQQTPGLILNALRYQQGQMDIELEVRDLNSLEQLKEKLIKTGNWQVEIQSASSSENKVQGRIQVRSTG